MKKKRKKPLKLTNKFEIFFFKFKYLIVGTLLLIFFGTPPYVVSLDDRNSLLLWSVLFSTVTIVSIIFFLMPTYRKVYSGDKSIWGYALLFILMSSLALVNLLLYVNGTIGIQQKITLDGLVSCKSNYRNKSHEEYNVIISTKKHGKININTTKEVYEKLKIDSPYHKDWKKGYLDILYYESK